MTDQPDSFAGIQSIIDAIPNAIFAKNRSHRIVLLNASACAFFGYSRETLLNRPDTELFPAEQIRIFHAADDLVFETGMESENEEQVTDGSGRTRQVLTRKRLAYLDGEQYLVASVTDVTAFREAEARNRYMAFHDPLTGLPNRRFFEEKLVTCLQHVTRDEQLAILVLDLDGFKHVNDNYGHTAGDRRRSMARSLVPASFQKRSPEY